MASGAGLQKLGRLQLVHGVRQPAFEFGGFGNIFIDLHPQIRFAALFQDPTGGAGTGFDGVQKLPDLPFCCRRLQWIDAVIDVI